MPVHAKTHLLSAQTLLVSNHPQPKGLRATLKNISGSYWCGVNSAFGDPHFRVTSPGEDPICFDVDTESENILALFADGSSALEINAQFKVGLTAGHISITRVTNGLDS